MECAMLMRSTFVRMIVGQVIFLIEPEIGRQNLARGEQFASMPAMGPARGDQQGALFRVGKRSIPVDMRRAGGIREAVQKTLQPCTRS